MADLNAAGSLGTPFIVRVEAGKIEEFARSIGSDNPDHTGSTAIAPPTFLTVQNFYEHWAGDEANPWRALAFDQTRELHAGQEFVFHREPPRAGTVLRAQSRIESVKQRTNSQSQELVFAVMVTEFRDEAGELVAEAICTGVELPPADEESRND